MCKRIGIGLLRLSLIAVFVGMAGSEANAQTCSTKYFTGAKCTSWKSLTSSGPKVCAQWCTGSAVCDVLVDGVKEKCEPGRPCPEMSCTAFGTEPVETTTPGVDCTTTLDPSCGILGIGFCLQPGCEPGHTNDECLGPPPSGQPFVHDMALSAYGNVDDCIRHGRCREGLELEAAPDLCPNDNWSFRFTPTIANLQVCYCPGGFERDPLTGDLLDNSQCCADIRRSLLEPGRCVAVFTNNAGVFGQPSCITQQCTLTQDYQLGDVIMYECDPFPPQ